MESENVRRSESAQVKIKQLIDHYGCVTNLFLNAVATGDFGHSSAKCAMYSIPHGTVVFRATQRFYIFCHPSADFIYNFIPARFVTADIGIIKFVNMCELIRKLADLAKGEYIHLAPGLITRLTGLRFSANTAGIKVMLCTIGKCETVDGRLLLRAESLRKAAKCF